jgi:hypothetical protein
MHPLVRLAHKGERSKVPWGFVIYRTTYTPFSDTHFAEIVQLLTGLAKYSVRKWKYLNPNDPAKLSAKTALQETYEPIIMYNKSEFDGMTLDAIRVQHQASIEQPVGERPITNEWCCLLVDEEVVQTLAGADPAALITTQNISEDYNNHWVNAVVSDPKTKMTRAG